MEIDVLSQRPTIWKDRLSYFVSWFVPALFIVLVPLNTILLIWLLIREFNR